MGITTSCAMIGTASGPMLGGVLLDWFGYWGAWSMPISLLFLDMIARMIMIEPPRGIVHDSTVSSSNDDENRPGQPRHDSEISPLLPKPPPVEVISGDTAEAGSNGNATSGNGSRNFYALLLQNTGVWASILCTMYQPAIRASFNATLPIHLRDTFHWSPSSIGAVFFCLHFPVVFLSPFIGRIRDRVGIRGPTALGCVLLCPLLCCLGFAGNKTSLIGGSEKTKEAIFITCICGIGLILPFLQGAGALYILSKWKLLVVKWEDKCWRGSWGKRYRQENGRRNAQDFRSSWWTCEVLCYGLCCILSRHDAGTSYGWVALWRRGIHVHECCFW